MKPHEKLGVAIADAGYAWTPKMRLAWEELDKDLALKTRDRDVFRNFTLAYEERIAELENELRKAEKK